MSEQPRNPSLAVLLVAMALLLQLGVAAYRGYTDKQLLQTAISNQDQAIEELRVVRRQLNSISGKTIELAQQGNTNAANIIQQMRAAGVNFSATE